MTTDVAGAAARGEEDASPQPRLTVMRSARSTNACHERMAALLHASSKGAFNLECCGDVAFTFSFRVATAGDDLPLIHTQWSQSAMVSSQYYSRRVWALGAVVQGAGGNAADGQGNFFELASPLQFLSGVELMQQIHSQAEAHATKAFKVVATYLFSKSFLSCPSGSRLQPRPFPMLLCFQLPQTS